MTMTPRERVLRAFKRAPGLPDRVPVQFEFCASLYEHFSKKLGIRHCLLKSSVGNRLHTRMPLSC
jgi:hypothetical protein